MTPGPTFDRVYLALKSRLRAGGVRPGQHLEPAALSDELNASITPIRDALHRLVGERLVEAPRGEGFRVPYLSEVGLRRLYSWNENLLLLAARARAWNNYVVEPQSLEPAATSGHGTVNTVSALFVSIARLSSNPEHIEAVQLVNDRLYAVRLIETELLGGVHEELAELRDRFEAPDAAGLRLAILRYHRRRIRATADIVDALTGS